MLEKCELNSLKGGYYKKPPKDEGINPPILRKALLLYVNKI